MTSSIRQQGMKYLCNAIHQRKKNTLPVCAVRVLSESLTTQSSVKFALKINSTDTTHPKETLTERKAQIPSINKI